LASPLGASRRHFKPVTLPRGRDKDPDSLELLLRQTTISTKA
jgi:hypothetical protein